MVRRVGSGWVEESDPHVGGLICSHVVVLTHSWLLCMGGQRGLLWREMI